MDQERAINGDWLILIAEANRYIGDHDKALEIVDAQLFSPKP